MFIPQDFIAFYSMTQTLQHGIRIYKILSFTLKVKWSKRF